MEAISRRNGQMHKNRSQQKRLVGLRFRRKKLNQIEVISDSKKHFLEIYLDLILGLHNSCHIHIFLALIMLNFPISAQALKALDSRELEESEWRPYTLELTGK